MKLRYLTNTFFLFLSLHLSAQIGKQLKTISNTPLGSKAFDLAKDKASDSFESKRAAFDTISFNYAIAFIDKSGLYENKEKGEGMTKLANNFLQKKQDKTDQEVARGFMDLGEFSYGTGKYRLAEVYLHAANIKYQDASLTEDPNYFRTLASLGLLYNTQGRYGLAEEYTNKALELRKEHIGVNSLAYASSVNNAAVLENDLGRYLNAEKMIEEALSITLKNQGKQSMAYAIHLNNKAIIFYSMGRYDQAIILLKECIEIAGNELREKSGTYLQLKTNLALMHQSLGQYKEAEFIYKEAISLQEKRLKLKRKSDPDYANMLNHLASLYMETNREKEAGELLTQSLEIYTSKFGDNHPASASAMSDLGNYYLALGEYKQAQPLLAKAYNARRNTLNENHPHVIQAAENFAILNWKLNYLEAAIDGYKNVIESSLEFIDKFFPSMSEVEKTKYWDRLKPRFHRFYSFAIDIHKQHPEMLDQMIEYQMATKGLLLSTNNKIKQAILSSGNKEVIDLYYNWQDQRGQLANYYTFTKEELTDQQVNLDSIEQAANQTERLLSQKSNVFADGLTKKRHSQEQIKKQLKTAEAAVEIVQIPWFENKFTDQVKYAAIIIKYDASTELVIFENGDELDKQYYNYYKNAIMHKLSDEYSYEQYWKPLASSLKGVKKVYFSPDGVFNQININTLKDEKGIFIIDNINVSLIGNTADLLLKKSTVLKKEAFVLGAPDFGDDGLISPLPGTLSEVNAINTKLKAKSYKTIKVTGKEATESKIKDIKSPGLLHIATHGFFKSDLGTSKKVFGVTVENAKNNPLLRSGLMLTGAAYNVKNENFHGFDEQDNGILTAYEAMSLSLENTKLVVLSACETGIGDVKAGEGVYGLQRAFMVAGAQQLIMSLWKVDDEATQLLMTNFYNEWLLGKDIHLAFRNAQLTLKKKYPEPYFWGGFVLVSNGG